MSSNLHTLPFTHFAGLRCYSPASGMSHRAGGRRVRGGAGRGTAGTRDACPYHAAVAGRPPYRWRGRAYPPAAGRPQSGCPSRGASPLAAVNRQNIRKFMQYTEIISANLCSTNALIDINYCNANALFDMPCGNSAACLTHLSSISVSTMTLIYNKPLQLGGRNATREGGNECDSITENP